MKTKYIKNRHLLKIIGILIASVLWFGGSNAFMVPSFMLVVGFGLLTAMLYYVMYGFISLAGLYGIRIERKGRISLYITVMIAFLVALQSLGELVSRDILILLPLVLLGFIYSSIAKNQTRRISG